MGNIPRVSHKVEELLIAAETGNLVPILEALLEQFNELASEIRSRKPRVHRRSEEHKAGEAILMAWPLDDDDTLVAAFEWISRVIGRTEQPVGRLSDLDRISKAIVRLTDRLKVERGNAGDADEGDPVEVRRQAWDQLIAESPLEELLEAEKRVGERIVLLEDPEAAAIVEQFEKGATK